MTLVVTILFALTYLAEEPALFDRSLDMRAVPTLRYDARWRSQAPRFAPPLEGEGGAVVIQ
jgi:hypothetical protein